ncbi:MAG TPA: hypothetical protein VLA26_07555 [Gammaproteobacteria bacterium]|nr:hypothetical protein [Gammaproteobacteria bacterium]
MLRLIVFTLSLLVLPAVAADCLEVAESGFDIDKSEVGAGEVHWHALIENECDRNQDAMLTVEFLDGDQQMIYEVQDQLVVERQGQAQAGRTIYVPAMYLDEIKGINIRLEARERPF